MHNDDMNNKWLIQPCLQITQNLSLTPGYYPIVTNIGIGLMILTPLAKYGLMLNPVIVTWELWLINKPSIESWCKFHAWRKHVINAAARILTSAVIVYIATVFPGFDRVVVCLYYTFLYNHH